MSLRQPRRKSCASTCLSCVAQFWGIEKTTDEIEDELGKCPKTGYTLGTCRDWAREEGLAAYVFSGSLADLEEHTAKGRPVIVTLRLGRQNHSVVVLGMMGEAGVLVMDPEFGKRRGLNVDDFDECWAKLDRPMLVIARAAAAPVSTR